MNPAVKPPTSVCEILPDRDRAILRVAGELDLAEAGTVASALADLVDVGIASVVVDLREVSFMDSTGLRTLLTAREAFESRGGRLSLVRGPDAVDRLLRLTGLESLFSYDDPVALR